MEKDEVKQYTLDFIKSITEKRDPEERLLLPSQSPIYVGAEVNRLLGVTRRATCPRRNPAEPVGEETGDETQAELYLRTFGVLASIYSFFLSIRPQSSTLLLEEIQ